jgi:hypothetical protein
MSKPLDSKSVECFTDSDTGKHWLNVKFGNGRFHVMLSEEAFQKLKRTPKLVEAQNSTCKQQAKARIIELLSNLEDLVAGGLSCTKIVTKLKWAAQEL